MSTRKSLRKYSSLLILGIIILLSGPNHLVFANAKVNSPAPAFSLIDINGKTHTLADYKGKTVVLEWVNYDCPYVKKHYDSKNMQSLQKKYTQKGIIWLSINSSAKGKQGNFSNNEIKKRSQEQGAAFSAYLLDESGKIGRLYGAKTTPHMYIIDGKGILQYMGAIDSIPSTDADDIAKAQNYVSAALDEILAGKKITTNWSKAYGCSVKY